VHVHAKFRRDWLNGCRDMANFYFPVWRPSAIFNFGNVQILTFPIVSGPNLHIPAKFCRDQTNVRHLEFSEMCKF